MENQEMLVQIIEGDILNDLEIEEIVLSEGSIREIKITEPGCIFDSYVEDLAS